MGRKPSKLSLRAADMFSVGMSIERISSTLDMKRAKVVSNISKYCMSSVYKDILNEYQVLQAYDDTDDIAAVAAKFKTTPETVITTLARSGVYVELESVSTVNHGFFDKLDAKSAYWLGMVYSAGDILTDLSGIQLTSDNRLDIDDFKTDIESQDEVWQENGMYGITIKSSRLVNALLMHGCVPKTSHVPAPPHKLKAGLRRDFVRGLLDGGGKIVLDYDGPSFVSLYGSHETMDWVREVATVEIGPPVPYKYVYKIQITDEPGVKYMLSWLYKDADRASLYNMSMYRRYDGQ